MQKESLKDLLQKRDIKIKDLEVRKGEFETEQGKKIPWKNYVLKVMVENVVMSFKLDKVFNDTLEEILAGD